MSIAKKYGIPESTVVNMIRDGVIAGTVIHHSDIISLFKTKLEQGKPRAQAILETADETGHSDSWVRRLINNCPYGR